MRLSVALLAITLAYTPVPTANAIRFKDVSKEAGLKYPKGRQIKFGGAAVADLDADGYPDLIFGHHNSPHAELYFNQRDGTFVKSSWKMADDIHAISPFRYSPNQKTMHFVVSVGGSNGQNPKPPVFFHVVDKRVVKPLPTNAFGVSSGGRGRSAVFLSLRPGRSRSDAIFTNARTLDGSPMHHAYASLGRLRFRRKPLGAFVSVRNSNIMTTDVDGDGRMEIVSFHQLCIHRVVADFRTRDISKTVLPHGLDVTGVSAVAELDFDNDGRWDLYIARARVGHLSWVPKIHRGDILLRNVGGRYVDVSARAGIPNTGGSMGVTVADFDNDGWVDIIVSQHKGHDILLKNRRDGTFGKRNAGLRRARGVPGDMATAVDYDRDGRVDLVVSEGSRGKKSLGGFYRILKNVGTGGNFIHVRVRNAPSRSATSLHAVAKVFLGSHVLMRRVGSPGTAVSNSYIELLHFGIGGRRAVGKLVVRWADGSSQVRFNVKAGSLNVFGS